MPSSLNVFIIGGTGLIGKSLKKMMLQAQSKKKRVTDGALEVVLVGYCNSKFNVKVHRDGEEEFFEKSPHSNSFNELDAFIAKCAGVSTTSSTTASLGSSSSANVLGKDGKENRHTNASAAASASSRDGPVICIADCTASEQVSNLYPSWLSKGWHVATPNKKCNSGPLDRYNACLQAANKGRAKWQVEATIGAGLPIVSTLRNLIATGDEIVSVQGIFSGTMSYLFNNWDGSGSFAALVAQAKLAGYTEPDPRDDLNGMDFARKVVILAREAGLTEMTLEDVSIESLVPKELESCTAEEFMTRYAEVNDGRMVDLAANAAADGGKVLRFVGMVNLKEKKAQVKLTAMPKTHAFASLQGADNILEIQTKRYGPAGNSTPMIIRGPGAGADVTAAGVFGDILSIANARF